MDKIILSGVKFYGHHGHTAVERKLGQRFSVDVELSIRAQKPGDQLKLSDTVDYSKVFKKILDVGEGTSLELIEGVAENIASVLLDSFPVEEVKVTVKKLHPPMKGFLDFAAVEISRKKK